MASNMKRTNTVRQRKKNAGGKRRKAKNRNSGSTRSAKELFGDK